MISICKFTIKYLYNSFKSSIFKKLLYKKLHIFLGGNNMKIDWASTQVYNTIMAVAVGIALLQMVRFGWLLLKGKKVNLDGWAIGFGVTGFVLTLTGAHMTLTWPLSKIGFPFDDIIFGEPSLAFGVMLLAAAVILWRKSNLLNADEKLRNEVEKDSSKLIPQLAEMAKPLSYFAAAMGLALLWTALAGIYYQLFAAPPEEPISGNFADYPMVEATFMSLLIAITGVGAILFPFALNKFSAKSGVVKVMGILWIIAGILFTLFGTMNYFTHIGLIINTM